MGEFFFEVKKFPRTGKEREFQISVFIGGIRAETAFFENFRLMIFMFGIFAGEECTYKEIDGKGCQTDTVDCLHKYIVGENLSEYVVKQNPDSFKDE